MGMFDDFSSQLSGLWGGDSSSVDNSKAYYEYANAMKQRAGAYDPIVNMGNDARNMSWEQYQKLVNDPNAVQNQVASGFQMSPYQNYMEDQTMQRMNYNAANSGMQNSGPAQQALQDDLLKMTGQFENDYINRGMNSYNTGLTGLNTLSNLGFESMGRQDNLYGQAYGADLYGKMSKNQYKADTDFNLSGYLGTGIGAMAGTMAGGPAGGMQGAQMMSGRGRSGAGNQQTFPSMYGGGNNYNTGNWSY
jgi:hypothetical protein